MSKASNPCMRAKQQISFAADQVSALPNQTFRTAALSQKPYWNGLPSPVEFSTRDALREVQGEHLPHG